MGANACAGPDLSQMPLNHQSQREVACEPAKRASLGIRAGR